MTSRTRTGVVGRLGEQAAALKRRLYARGRPGRLMRAWNRLDARMFAAGVLAPRQAATLVVAGRRTGRPTAVPVAVADHEGAEYLVAMLGPETGWVRNVRAAGGRAMLRRRGREVPVRLEEVPVERRAPVLKRYLAVAPGARPHVAVDRRAPVEEFEQVADRHPVFRVTERDADAA